MKRVMLARPLRSTTTDAYVRKNKIAGNNNPSPPPLREWEGEGYLPSGVKEEKKVDQVLALVKELTVAEQKQVLARLALSQQVAKLGSDRDIDMWSGAVQSALTAAILPMGGAVLGIATIKRTVGLPSLFAPVDSFMQASGLSKLSVTERQSVYVMLAKLVTAKAQYISRKGGAPLSAKLVASVATNVAAIFDQAFPGYLENGYAHIVAKQLTSSKSN